MSVIFPSEREEKWRKGKLQFPSLKGGKQTLKVV